MTIFKAVRQLWSGPEAPTEDRNRILKERIAKLLDETSDRQASPGVEQTEKTGSDAVLA